MLFSVLMILPNEQYEIPYDSIEECLKDKGLEILFRQRDVKAIVLFNGARLTRNLSDWDNFTKHLVSNSSTIMRKYIE